MSDESVPTWGYSKDGPKLFDLKKGQSLPKGYFDHPDKAKADVKNQS